MGELKRLAEQQPAVVDLDVRLDLAHVSFLRLGQAQDLATEVASGMRISRRAHDGLHLLAISAFRGPRPIVAITAPMHRP